MKTKLLLIICLFAMGTACTGGGSGNTTTMEYMPDMMDSPSHKAFEHPMRSPVKGTVPVGFNPYPYTKAEGEKAGQELSNPLKVTEENLKLGKEKFDTYCLVCHGNLGEGDGTIVPKFPKPPTFHSKKVRGWSDGRLFHVMTRGQNLMPSYSNQVFPHERWAIALYIRALQRSQNPTAQDLKAFEKAKKQGWYPKD